MVSSMKKLKKKEFIELIIIFCFTLAFTMFCSRLTLDEAWNYGFAYSIANGLIPYRDFNMIITPLHPFIGSVFLLIFGKNILSFHIFNALICTALFYQLKKTTNKYVYLVYIFILSLASPNYNLLCLLFLFVLINLEKKKSNDYLIGIVLGLTFLTKQNIGIYLCFPSLLTKNIKKIFKRIIGFLIPVSLFVIYLLAMNSFNDFINYAFGGMSSFAKDNLYIDKFLILVILCLIYLIYRYIKTNDIKYVYLLLFQLIAYPLFNFYHIFLAFIPVLTDFLANLKFKIPKIYIKLYYIILTLIIIFVNCYNFSTGVWKVSDDFLVFKYRTMEADIAYKIELVTDYIKNNDNVFIIDDEAYLYRLETDMSVTKYDLLNNGNLGKNGEEIIIKEFEQFCKKNTCRFLLDLNEFFRGGSQTNEKIHNYVKNNYQIKGAVANFTIYGSEVVE